MCGPGHLMAGPTTVSAALPRSLQMSHRGRHSSSGCAPAVHLCRAWSDVVSRRAVTAHLCIWISIQMSALPQYWWDISPPGWASQLR